MKTRLTAWLSALLLFSAVFGTPVARVSIYRANACYVYCEERRQLAEEAVEEIERPRPIAPVIFVAAAPADRPACARLPFSLFQRPPPALSV